MRISDLLLAAAVSAAFSFGAFASDAVPLIEKGEAQLRAGEIDAAVATLEEAIAADPESSLAYTRLGGAQIMKQDYSAGVESFKRAIALDSNNASAFVGMAVAYLHSGRYSLARAALEEAKRIDPSKQAKVDELIAWIDKREAGGAH